MNNHHLRSILLNLQYRLSDNDRERLHFYLKNDVPRQVGDDSTLRGTLNLMQSLFDQDKINEKDFTLLIDAFKQIQCFDAVHLLNEYQRQMLLSGLNQSTQSLASIMPSNIQEFLYDYDDERQDVTDKFVPNQTNYSNSNNNIIGSNNININPININGDTQGRFSLRKPWLCISLLPNKCFVLPFILFILTLGVFIVVLIGGMEHINNLENNPQVKQVVTPNQNNQPVKQLNNLLSEKSATIEQLNQTLMATLQRRNTIFIKAGRNFGDDGGVDFDDSLLPMFTSSYYLSGFVFSDIDHFNACQFIYASSHHNQSRIESNVHGDDGRKMINATYKYLLQDDERIEYVQVKSSFMTFIPNNTYSSTKKIIRGLKFVTTKRRAIPPDINLIGNDVESEHFPGYTVGYATGRSDQNINQLQFFWYLTEQY